MRPGQRNRTPLAKVQDRIRSWIIVAKELGCEIPEPDDRAALARFGDEAVLNFIDSRGQKD